MDMTGMRAELSGIVQASLADHAVRVTRFWMSVDRAGDGCWLWTGSVNKDGYGEFFDGFKMRGAHDLAVEYTTGESRLRGWDTCHACHVRRCCNPAHLRYAPRQSNVDDMVAAHRQAHGERNGRSKLTEAEVVAIRQRRAAGATGAVLADEYGISASLVAMIVKGTRWQHVGGPIRAEHGNRKHERHASS